MPKSAAAVGSGVREGGEGNKQSKRACSARPKTRRTCLSQDRMLVCESRSERCLAFQVEASWCRVSPGIFSSEVEASFAQEMMSPWSEPAGAVTWAFWK